MTATSSRRRYLRLELEGIARWWLIGEAEQSARESELRDLSLNGFCFTADGNLEVEAPITFELHLQGEQEAVEGEGVITWSVWDEKSGGGFLVGAQFSQVRFNQVLTLLLKAYPDNPEVRACLCAEVQFCSDAEKGRCPAYQQGKNCWEFEQLECCHAPRSECCECPYAALAFLI